MKKNIEYLLKNDIAEIPKRGRKEMKQILFDNQKFRYNKDKPISKRLTQKLNQVKKTNEYRSYALRNAKDIISEGKVKNLLRRYAVKNKFRVEKGKSAFKNYANNLKMVNKHFQGEQGLSMISHQESLLLDFLKKNRNMKLNIRTEALFTKPAGVDEEEQEDMRESEFIYNLPATRFNIHNEDDLNSALEDSVKQILLQIEQLEGTRSNLRFKRVISITFHYDRYDPTRAGRYIELPKSILSKKACVNIKNQDNKCLKYCIQSVVYDKINKHHPEEMFHYNKLKDDIINWEGVNFPAGNRDIDRLEENNSSLISVNIYEPDYLLNEEKVLKSRTTKVQNAKYHVDLLKFFDNKDRYHYAVIKNISRLLSSQTSKNLNTKHYCRYCCKPFTKLEGLNKHYDEGCKTFEGQHYKLPEKGSTIEFFKYNTKLECPFVIYGDFECLTTNSENGIKGTYQEHKPCGYMLNVVNRNDKTSTPYLYRGEDCMDKFVEQLSKIKDEIDERMRVNVPMEELTDEQELDFKNAKRCSICNKLFEDGDKKVRDHCHFTGKYRGCAHVKCNLDYSFRYFKIPVFFHNLKNYDSHLIIQKANELNKRLNENKKIDVIVQNSEKFITFSFGYFQFKDSLSFLSASLDKLVKLNKYNKIDINDDGELKGSNQIEDFEKNFRYSNTNPYTKSITDLDLLTEKGVYPYDYMDTFERFKETNLPDKEHFYSKLSETHISDEDYERANLVCKHFNIKNLGEYHDLYLMTDVYLLTDVFENFRDMCLDYYGLDPAYYVTLPNYSWNAFLYTTGIKLENIHIKEMYEMIESGLRGGMTQCSYKKVDANNKYMNKEYDKRIPSSYINYLDANNLYGLAMCKKLPYKHFKWVYSKFDEKKVMKYNDNDDTGYILEVDLEYPKEIHDLHKDYPMAPEIMTINENMLSNVQKDIYRYYYNTEAKDEKTNKLVLNVMDKKKYVLHISALQFYLKHGLKLKKVHRAISFSQKDFLRPFIEFNTEKRKQAKTEFEKDLFKLMNNSIFGKTMENVRNHLDFELVSTPERFQKCVNNPTYRHRHIITEDLVGVEKNYETVRLNKPIYMGFSILDFSKVHMYSFYYDVLKPKYDDNIKLVYTDTDSYVIKIDTDDVYKDFQEINEYMDFSDYPESHPNYDKTNKKVLGKFKDEAAGKIITSFIGLKPKSYCYKVLNETKEEKKSKGIVKHKVKNQLTYKKYEETLNRELKEQVTFNTIRSKDHQIYSITQTKYSLSPFDNKRFWYNENESLPFGHYQIEH